MADKRKLERKLYVAVTNEFDDRFMAWAKRLGLTKSQLGNICVQAGLNAVIRAVSPEEAFSSEQIVDILETAKDRGLNLEIRKD